MMTNREGVVRGYVMGVALLMSQCNGCGLNDIRMSYSDIMGGDDVSGCGCTKVSWCGDYYVLSVGSSDVIGLMDVALAMSEGVILFLIVRSMGNCDVSGCGE